MVPWLCSAMVGETYANQITGVDAFMSESPVFRDWIDCSFASNDNFVCSTV